MEAQRRDLAKATPTTPLKKNAAEAADVKKLGRVKETISNDAYKGDILFVW